VRVRSFNKREKVLNFKICVSMIGNTVSLIPPKGSAEIKQDFYLIIHLGLLTNLKIILTTIYRNICS
jgi:hypothetical protein